eukprot:2881093-Pyramimonas_sp.AAC.1
MISLSREWSKVVNGLQRGFIQGRQFGTNIIELDAHARAYSMLPCAELDLPALVAFDFAQAFPSVSHRWMRHMLQAIRLPTALIDFLMFLYSGVNCYSEFGGVLIFMFPILSGSIHGCPASGTIFAVCMEPFVRDFDHAIVSKSRGIVRLCADDVGAAILKL